MSRVDEDAIEQEFAKLDREIHKESDKTKKEDVALPDAPTDRILPEVPTTLEDQKKIKESIGAKSERTNCIVNFKVLLYIYSLVFIQ